MVGAHTNEVSLKRLVSEADGVELLAVVGVLVGDGDVTLLGEVLEGVSCRGTTKLIKSCAGSDDRGLFDQNVLLTQFGDAGVKCP